MLRSEVMQSSASNVSKLFLLTIVHFFTYGHHQQAVPRNDNGIYRERRDDNGDDIQYSLEDAQDRESGGVLRKIRATGSHFGWYLVSPNYS